MSIAILVPVLHRPHRVAPLVESVRAATPKPFRVLFIADPDDLAEQSAIAQWGFESIAVHGNYAAKINAGVEHTDEPLIFLAADDLEFHPGWLEAATAKLTDEIQVVGTNDLCNPRTINGDHSTHTLITREYAKRGTIDDPFKVLHEGYPHEWVDDELIETAKSRGAYAHAKDSIVEHLHPDAGKAPMDDLYAARPRRMRQGRQIFLRRRSLWTT